MQDQEISLQLEECSDFLTLYENEFKNDLKSCLSFSWTIIFLSLNKKKLKELAILPNCFVNHQTRNVLYLHWYLPWIHHVETRILVNKRDTSKQYETTNRLNIFFTNKKVGTSS